MEAATMAMGTVMGMEVAVTTEVAATEMAMAIMEMVMETEAGAMEAATMEMGTGMVTAAAMAVV